MSINFGREICGVLDLAAGRQWLVTNGIGGYTSGTVAGILTRRYHRLLVAALKPPLMRTVLLAKLDETALYDGRNYSLGANFWNGRTVNPDGYRHIESFDLEGTIPTWRFACADALLEKRVWMQPGSNTTYVQYDLHRAIQPLVLKLKALVNYRDYHDGTNGRGWQMNIDTIEHGVHVTAFEGATPLYLYLLSDRSHASPAHEWYYEFDLARERDREDHLYAATFDTTLQPGESLTFVASTERHPVLAEIIDWHRQGTRYNIHLDLNDGLLYAGETGVQLTWMDAKVGDWVVTPRIGKPIEVNALWCNALGTMASFARKLGKPYQKYERMQELANTGFKRFWNDAVGYCYDVLNGTEGHDESLQPNQIFAVSLSKSPLTPVQQRDMVESCGRSLLTSHGLRSLDPNHPKYQGHYGGDRLQRDSVYHEGTVWGWLIGPFVLAHLRVFNDPAQARSLLQPMANHLCTDGVGSLSEIFDGDTQPTRLYCSSLDGGRSASRLDSNRTDHREF